MLQPSRRPQGASGVAQMPSVFSNLPLRAECGKSAIRITQRFPTLNSNNPCPRSHSEPIRVIIYRLCPLEGQKGPSGAGKAHQGRFRVVWIVWGTEGAL